MGTCDDIFVALVHASLCRREDDDGSSGELKIPW